MNSQTSNRSDKRVPVALSLLAAVIALLGAHQIALPGDSLIPGQSVRMATAMVSSPAH